MMQARQAREASIPLAATTHEQRCNALKKIKQTLDENRSVIIEKNNLDLERAKSENISPVLVKRLAFGDEKIDELLASITDLINLEDPVNKTKSTTELDEGLELFQITAPIGVIGVIFESRPDALVQISCLCLKSANAVLLKGGSEAKETNKILYELIAKATKDCCEGWIQLLESRDDVSEMLNCHGEIDLIIPRGSNAFVQHVMNNTKIPVMGHSDGICHVYVDEAADLEMALKVVIDSKTQYAAVCNALETLVVHQSVAKEFLPKLKEQMQSVELRGDAKVQEIIEVGKASEDDWDTEYNDLILSITIVDSLEDAITFINKHTSKHTDAIVTSNEESANRFLSLVDSANVFWNCSTRFADGYRYGLGAEVGISTAKIHARGPVGLEGLVIYKWKLIGKGHVVDTYAKGKKFTHKKR